MDTSGWVDSSAARVAGYKPLGPGAASVLMLNEDISAMMLWVSWPMGGRGKLSGLCGTKGSVLPMAAASTSPPRMGAGRLRILVAVESLPRHAAREALIAMSVLESEAWDGVVVNTANCHRALSTFAVVVAWWRSLAT